MPRNCLLMAALLAVGWAASARGQDDRPLRLARTNAAPSVVAARQPIRGTVDQPLDSGSLSLADLEDIALRRNPGLARASAEVDAARGHWLQVGLRPNPTVGYLGEEIGNEDSAGMHGAFASQEFVRGGKLALNRRVAGQQLQKAEYRLESQRYRVLTDVRGAYYEVLAAQRGVELSTELARVADEASETAEQVFRGRQTSRFEPLQAGIEARQMGIVLQTAKNRHATAWRGLAAVVGEPDMPTARLVGDLNDSLPEYNFEESLGNLLVQSPQLAAAWADVERARWAIERAAAEPVPNVEVEATVAYDTASDDTWAGVQVGLPLPLHDRNQGEIAKSVAELRAAEANVNRLKLWLHERLAVAFERYDNARYQAGVYAESILPDAQDALNLANLGYREEELDYLSVLTAQRQYTHANLAYLDALREVRASAVVIEGLLLSGSLEENE